MAGRPVAGGAVPRHEAEAIAVQTREFYRQQGIGSAPVGFGHNPAVLVIDMQRDFLDPDVFLYLGADARRVVPPIAELLAAAREGGLPIFYTRSVYRQDLRDAGCWVYKFTRLDEQGLKEGTPGAEIIPELAPRPGDRIIVKRRPSGFFATDLDLQLRTLGVDTTIVAGCTTSGCVRATAVDAFSHNFRVIVPRECVADRGPEPHEANLFDIDMKYGDVLPLTAVLDALRAAPRGQGTGRSGT